MNILDIVHKTKIENFTPIKHKILDAIDSMGKFSYEYKDQKITNTDWHLPNNIDRTYWPYVIDYIEQHHNTISQQLEYKEISIKNFWFQQYDIGDWHGLHLHRDCVFSNVVYIENSIGTTFVYKKKEYTVPVEEGTILTFPTFLIHGSKPNPGPRKTIIAYNSDPQTIY
jgi:hypothetical protein